MASNIQRTKTVKPKNSDAVAIAAYSTVKVWFFLLVRQNSSKYTNCSHFLVLSRQEIIPNTFILKIIICLLPFEKKTFKF